MGEALLYFRSHKKSSHTKMCLLQGMITQESAQPHVSCHKSHNVRYKVIMVSENSTVYPGMINLPMFVNLVDYEYFMPYFLVI